MMRQTFSFSLPPVSTPTQTQSRWLGRKVGGEAGPSHHPRYLRPCRPTHPRYSLSPSRSSFAPVDERRKRRRWLCAGVQRGSRSVCDGGSPSHLTRLHLACGEETPNRGCQRKEWSVGSCRIQAPVALDTARCWLQRRPVYRKCLLSQLSRLRHDLRSIIAFGICSLHHGPPASPFFVFDTTPSSAESLRARTRATTPSPPDLPSKPP